MDTLNFNPESINWGADWWKLLIIAFSALLLAYLSIRLALYVLRMVGVLVCLAVGILGGYMAQMFNASLAARMPENIARFAPAATALAGFIICYGIAIIIMYMVRKPAQALEEKNSKDK